MVFDVDDDDDVDDGDDSAIDKLINEFVFVSGKPILAFLASLFGISGKPICHFRCISRSAHRGSSK